MAFGHQKQTPQIFKARSNKNQPSCSSFPCRFFQYGVERKDSNDTWMEGCSKRDQLCAIRSLSSTTGGDSGGTATSWNAADSIDKTFLVAASDSLVLPPFLEERVTEPAALDELLLSIDSRKFSLERDGADAITELNTPDSLKLWIMTWRAVHKEMSLERKKKFNYFVSPLTVWRFLNRFLCLESVTKSINL